MPTEEPSLDAAAAHTLAWLEHAVIGLNLCPFAKAPWAKGLVRCVASGTREPPALLDELRDELRRLAEADPAVLETTLLVAPRQFAGFADFNDFLDEADAALAELGLEGTLQIASFHPHYQFAGTEPDDIDNATNRAPYPTLHLLREASIERAVEAFPDASAIYEANIRTLRTLGEPGWRALCRRILGAG